MFDLMIRVIAHTGMQKRVERQDAEMDALITHAFDWRRLDDSGSMNGSLTVDTQPWIKQLQPSIHRALRLRLNFACTDDTGFGLTPDTYDVELFGASIKHAQPLIYAAQVEFSMHGWVSVTACMAVELGGSTRPPRPTSELKPMRRRESEGPGCRVKSQKFTLHQERLSSLSHIPSRHLTYPFVTASIAIFLAHGTSSPLISALAPVNQ
ncbi:hypothetical protein C8R44DRAFT_753797 [Mycena epipterygia]|nr:hypothetical protein C8R44DRAFT_753797 [Mycena epipterygia]